MSFFIQVLKQILSPVIPADHAGGFYAFLKCQVKTTGFIGFQLWNAKCGFYCWCQFLNYVISVIFSFHIILFYVVSCLGQTLQSAVSKCFTQRNVYVGWGSETICHPELLGIRARYKFKHVYKYILKDVHYFQMHWGSLAGKLFFLTEVSLKIPARRNIRKNAILTAFSGYTLFT